MAHKTAQSHTWRVLQPRGCGRLRSCGCHYTRGKPLARAHADCLSPLRPLNSMLVTRPGLRVSWAVLTGSVEENRNEIRHIQAAIRTVRAWLDGLISAEKLSKRWNLETASATSPWQTGRKSNSLPSTSRGRRHTRENRTARKPD